jgi:hypothetical protein
LPKVVEVVKVILVVEVVVVCCKLLGDVPAGGGRGWNKKQSVSAY